MTGIERGRLRRSADRLVVRVHSCNIAVIFFKVDRFFADDEFVFESEQEVSELLDVLSRDVPDLRRRLGPVAQQTFDGHLDVFAVLLELIFEIEHGFVEVISGSVFSRTAAVLFFRMADDLGDGHVVVLDGKERRISSQKLFQSGFGASGNLPHLLGEAFGSKLTAKIVEASGLALVKEPLQEEEEGKVAYVLIILQFHPGIFSPPHFLQPPSSLSILPPTAKRTRSLEGAVGPAHIRTDARSYVTYYLLLLLLLLLLLSSPLLTFSRRQLFCLQFGLAQAAAGAAIAIAAAAAAAVAADMPVFYVMDSISYMLDSNRQLHYTVSHGVRQHQHPQER